MIQFNCLCRLGTVAGLAEAWSLVGTSELMEARLQP